MAQRDSSGRFVKSGGGGSSQRGGIEVSVSAVGQDAAITDLMRMANEAPEAIGGALYRRGNEVMADSQENYVPVDEGPLRASGHVELPEIDGDDVSVLIGYGGSTVDYAFVQHEGLDFEHVIGEAKFLEKPLLAAADTMAADIAADLVGLMGGS